MTRDDKIDMIHRLARELNLAITFYDKSDLELVLNRELTIDEWIRNIDTIEEVIGDLSILESIDFDLD